MLHHVNFQPVIVLCLTMNWKIACKVPIWTICFLVPPSKKRYRKIKVTCQGSPCKRRLIKNYCNVSFTNLWSFLINTWFAFDVTFDVVNLGKAFLSCVLLLIRAASSPLLLLVSLFVNWKSLKQAFCFHAFSGWKRLLPLVH